MVLKCCVYDFERLLIDFEMNFNDLSSCLNNLREREPTKGGGGLRPPPPFVGGSLKILRISAEIIKIHFKIIKQPIKIFYTTFQNH